MKQLLATFIFTVSACGGLGAQTPVWQPSPGHTQMPLWPGAVPDAQPAPGPETVEPVTDKPVAGKPWTAVQNVSQPTITVYSPKGKNTGAAVVVFPGGGYEILAIDLEGTEVADWLTSRGITCVLLKYRVPASGPYWDEKTDRRVYPPVMLALEDAQRALGLVRQHAAEWGVDPHKVGVLGFSAGGHLAASISTNFERRLYPVVDAADQESCRPDFSVSVYPGHLWANEDKDPHVKRADERFELRPDIRVTAQTPPTFLLQAEDDHIDGVNQSLVYYLALKDTKVPVEMHLYPHGGHAFGLRHRADWPITDWPQLVETWLRSLGMIAE